MDSVAVAIHDVTPATLDDCVAIRETLDDWRIDRATLLAIPARAVSLSSPMLRDAGLAAGAGGPG